MWLSIVGQLLTGLIALAALWKDWANYGAISKRFGRRLPIALAVIIILITSFTVWQTWIASEREAKNAGRIEELGNELKRNDENSERRSKQQSEFFQNAFNDQNKRLSELQTKINIDPLLRQNTALSKEIQDIHAKVNAAKARIEQPLEKAELVANLTQQRGQTLNNITVPLQTDGTVEFTVYVHNVSKFQARVVTIFLRLCTQCNYATEPAGFVKTTPGYNFDRFMEMDHFPAGMATPIPLKVKPPPLCAGFEVAVTPRCDNCTANAPNKLFVSIKR